MEGGGSSSHGSGCATFGLVNPWVALALVLVGTALSVVLVRSIYHRERNHAMSLQSSVILTAWFLFSYTVMAFLVRPH
jgi:predicted branched-subunit amino acid permease